jgi:MYXO-CTERM domain-containing protein
MDAANNLDPATGFWTSSGHPVQRHTYDLTILVPETHELVLLGGGAYAGNCLFGLDQGQLDQIAVKLAHYDVGAGTWTASAAGPQWGFAGSDYDPETGLAVLFDGDLYTYDPATQAVAHHKSFADLGIDFGYANNLVFFPPDQSFYYFTRGETTGVFRLALDRTDLAASTVTQLAPTGDAFASDESGFAYDATNAIIGGAVRDGVFHAYDPAADAWIARTMDIDPASESAAIGSVAFHALSYDPVNNVFLFIGDGASGRHTWAYRFDLGDDGTVDTSGDGSESGPPPTTGADDDGTPASSSSTSAGVDDTTGATAGDTTGAPADDDANGCGCRSETDGSRAWWLALLVLGPRSRRRVR